MHFRKTARARFPSIYSFYLNRPAPHPARGRADALSKRTPCDGMFPDYRLDYAETQRRQGDALLRSDSSSPFTSREFLRLSCIPLHTTQPPRLASLLSSSAGLASPHLASPRFTAIWLRTRRQRPERSIPSLLIRLTRRNTPPFNGGKSKCNRET